MYITTHNIQPITQSYNSENSTDHGTHRQFNRVLEQYVDYLGDHPHQKYKSHMAGLHRKQDGKNQQNQQQQPDIVDNVVLTHEMLELKLAREANKTMPQVHWELYDYPEHVIDSNA